MEALVLANLNISYKEEELILHRAILPVNQITLSKDVKFYEFPLCSSPLTYAQARAHLKDYVFSIAEAIMELHDSGYAHFDIRPENICFIGVQAVL